MNPFIHADNFFSSCSIPILPHQILQHHILGTPHPTTDIPMSGSITLETLLKGQSLTLSMAAGGIVKVTGAYNRSALVKIANIKAGASIIHVIDTVLLPSTVISNPSKSYLLGDAAPSCECINQGNGCVISKPAPPGLACHCSTVWGKCTGTVGPCQWTSIQPRPYSPLGTPYCSNPDTSVGSCYQGQWQYCGGYSPSCDCDYHSGGCSISVPPPGGTACHCDYGLWSCSGFVTECLDSTNDSCINPGTNYWTCMQGQGDCGAY